MAEPLPPELPDAELPSVELPVAELPGTVDASRVQGRQVLVCGAGVAGASAVRALLRCGAQVLLTASAEGPAVEQLVAAGARWTGPLTAVPAGVQLVVTSPGLRPSDPLLASSPVPVWGELELAWQLRGPGAAPWLALTGTNGKTTTVHMLEAILRAAGWRALAVGNVGVAVIDAVLADEPYDVLAVEVSSQQLHFAPSLRVAAGALLNLAADHLDWHGSMAAYAEAKARLLDAEIAIGNLDDPAVAQLLAGASAPVRVGFTLDEPADGQLGVQNGHLVSRAFGDGAGGSAAVLAAVTDVRPAGAHNVANALAAAALARAGAVPVEAVTAGLADFVPDRHRNELVHEAGGVDWVDDSKATNAHAARGSLLSYPRVVWIAGGQLKGADVDDLVAEVAGRLAGAVLLGVDREVIADALRRHAPEIPVIEVSSTDDGAMLEVVRAAAELAVAGDTVLLAPAGASYDMFANYSARGEAFAAAARAVTRPGSDG